MMRDAPSPAPQPASVPTDQDLRDLAESADVGLHFIDRNGIISWANSAAYRHLGYSADEYIGHPVSEFHADSAVIEDILARLEDGVRVSQQTVRLRSKDGSIRHVEITSSPRFLENDGKRQFVNAWCFTQDITRRRAVEQARDVLVRAGQSLSRSLDVNTTLTILSNIVVPDFADWYAVHLLDEQGLVVPARIHHTDPSRVELVWSAVGSAREDVADGRTAPAMTIRTGESTLAPSVDDDLLAQVARSEAHLEILKSVGIHSAMLVPLKLEDETIGSMTFVAAESKRVYDAQDLVIAEALASRAALAIANARLHRQATEARQAAEKAAERLAILLRASESIAQSLEADDALRQLARFATPVLADYCVTYRMDFDGTIHRVGLAHADSASQSLVEALVRAGPPSLNDAHGVGAVLRTGEAALTSEVSPELAEAAAQNAEHATVLRALKPCSTVIVPLTARGRTLGGAAFVATERSDRRYTTSDLALAEELAHRVALLVDNARLYEEGQAANRAMEDMLSVVAHDLRNPLNTIVTSTSLLGLDLPADQHGEAAASIRRAADRMGRLLNDLLDITRIGQRRMSMQMQQTDLAALVRDTAAMHAPVAQAKGVRLSLPGARSVVAVEADPSRVVQALSNLVDNALKFTPAGGEVQIDVERSNGAVHLAVTDTGPGIAEELIPRLFDRFWRAEGDSHTGLGLGLSIAKGIVDAHRGHIEVANTPGKGARFTMVLPESQTG